ncbi:MAG: pitrilysin family protein [Bacillota bacterium]|nr:pitrilysin family protein [Bacillota bacterium]
MKTKTIEYSRLNEKIFSYEHSSGLKVFVIPKKGYSKKYATFSTHYGSINNSFVIPGESEVTNVPDGIAHFLEHKLFEQKDGSVMEKFSALGSNPNAYTSFNQTVYLFSCTDKFDENFRLLLNFVQNPFITEESVEKEKGIIGQEIRMYDDDPGWRSFFNLLGSFYEKNPVSIDIAGTVESISKINRDILYKCYNTFYHPSNMVIVVVGETEPSEVFKMVDQLIVQTGDKPEIKRIFPQDSPKIKRNYIEQKLAVGMPIFQMGFRDNRLDSRGIEALNHEVAIRILLDMIMGRSSELYNRLYDDGLINASFDTDYTLEENYAFSMFGGESRDPEAVRDRIAEEIRLIGKNGLDRNRFEQVKKAQMGKFLRQLNSVERISNLFITVYFKGVYLFDYFDVYDRISFEYIRDIFHEHFNLDNMALSAVKPV